jgi:hypothetical protein
MKQHTHWRLVEEAISETAAGTGHGTGIAGEEEEEDDSSSSSSSREEEEEEASDRDSRGGGGGGFIRIEWYYTGTQGQQRDSAVATVVVGLFWHCSRSLLTLYVLWLQYSWRKERERERERERALGDVGQPRVLPGRRK